ISIQSAAIRRCDRRGGTRSRRTLGGIPAVGRPQPAPHQTGRAQRQRRYERCKKSAKVSAQAIAQRSRARTQSRWFSAFAKTFARLVEQNFRADAGEFYATAFELAGRRCTAQPRARDSLQRSRVARRRREVEGNLRS